MSVIRRETLAKLTHKQRGLTMLNLAVNVHAWIVFIERLAISDQAAASGGLA
jgi:hypothetical protein